MPLRDKIYDRIKTRIICGDLAQGEKLSEIELAESMGVSRTPLREAFRQLQMEGYIDALPNRGAYVCKLLPKEVEQIYSIIALLEGYAAKQAAKQMSHVELDKLKKLDDRLQLYASRKKYNDYIEKNVEFHRLITNLSGNGHVAKLVTELRMRIYRYRLMSVTIPGYLSIYASQHKKIIDALGERNSVLARKYMEEHVTFVQDILVKFLKENMNL